MHTNWCYQMIYQNEISLGTLGEHRLHTYGNGTELSISAYPAGTFCQPKELNAYHKEKPVSSMLKTGDASRFLNVHANTLRRWSDDGVIKAYSIGPRGDRRFRPEDIAAMLVEEPKKTD